MKALSLALILGLVCAYGCVEDQPKTPDPAMNNSTQSDSPGETATTAGGAPTTPSEPDPVPAGEDSAPGATMPKEGDEVAVLDTNHGQIILKFFPDKAPKHVANFKKLAKENFYKGTKFHRVIPDFMIQGGDPNSKDNDRTNDGTGGPGYSVDAEFNDTPHTRGILSMARSQDPNSAGSQFFITVADANFLDGQYTAFGQVVKGMSVADKIVALPRDANDNPKPENEAVIKDVKIVKWPVK